MGGFRRISHDMIRAAKSSAPRIATGVRRGAQERQFITTRSCRTVSTFTRRTLSITPTQPARRTFWNTSNDTDMASATTFFDFKPKDKRGVEYPLSKLNGKVVLVVNTASKCGFTPQFAGLEKLYKDLKAQYADQFEIIGFPCNQFGGQDPGSNDQIQEFCQLNYGVSFPILGKIDVNGDGADPTFEWLKNEKAGLMGLKRVKWNFEKFLVGKDGKVKGRWASTKKPEDLKADIVKEIEAK
ncbi:thioredoxin-like protein [Boeremia exigua]|uniref:thioredoxin-like protein n=1 Tax=Boeremia exigua TaxID=749465 RepID=UPI001E8D4090|nr:thioredoxin-like protein [Boeremia exigua]KAH6625253.1 thioredoxin-like protein [Boeremia exigua]